MKTQPMQPIYVDVHGVVRFHANAIIRKLIDARLIDLNDISTWDVPPDDRDQFWQLMGYSVSGFGSLSFTQLLTTVQADAEAEKLLREQEKKP